LPKLLRKTAPMPIPTGIPSADELNAMTDDERKAFAEGPVAKTFLEVAGTNVTMLRWNYRHAVLASSEWRNGSAFFVDTGTRLIVVTAEHVYRAYLKARDNASKGSITCQLGNLLFKPEERLIDASQDLDIATFEISAEELIEVGKRAFTLGDGIWPPPHPGSSGLNAIVAGFPEKTTLWISPTGASFGMFLGAGPIGSHSDRQISMQIDRLAWIDTLKVGVPPPGFDFGGISGGPMMMVVERDRRWHHTLAGVVVEFPTSALGVETVVAVPAHFIAADGKLNSNSAPTRFVTVP
jgi:hypothetical protein